MQVDLLGPVRVSGRDLSGTRLRTLLARLALEPGKVVTTPTLIAALWPDQPPANALHTLVSRLRRAVGAEVVESDPNGYRLVIGAADVDVHEFERLAAEGRAALKDGRVGEAAEILRAALALWRGPALAGMEDAPFAGPVITRLDEVRLSAQEDRVEADLRLGVDVIAELTSLTAAHPLRERPAGQLMRALALAGRQADALGAYERVRADLADELGVDPAADLRELHLAVLRGDLAPAKANRGLPAARTSFVGRLAELAVVGDLLKSSRLVTLVGPGGAGKTRLSVELAATVDGPVWFVELAAVRAPEDVSAAVLAALGVRESPLMEGPGVRAHAAFDRVAEVLSGQRCLLVLDNCEHLIATAAAFTDALLGRCPRLTVLATSREALAITGESVFQVGPLALPADTSAEEVAGSDAVRLFADRASAVSPGFTVDADAVEICRRLDGLPLALELAAARLRSMTVRQVADRLDDRFRLLTGGSRTALPRHRTLRAVVEWSWGLLEEAERELAARLSVFHAPGTLEAVAAVAEQPAEDVVYVLASLVEKSLVLVGDGRDGQVRYRMLETVRAYAAERLDESGATPRTRDVFGRYFLALVEEVEPKLRTGEQIHWLARLKADQENLVAALRYAIAVVDADLSCRLAVRAVWFWMLVGGQQEALAFAKQASALPGPAPAHARAALRTIGAFDPRAGIPQSDELRGLLAELTATGAVQHYPMLGMIGPMLTSLAGDVEGAIADLEARLDHPDLWARGISLLGLAFVRENFSEPTGMDDLAQRALEAFRKTGDRWGQGIAIWTLAEHQSLRGEHAAAIAAHRESLRLVEELGALDEIPTLMGKLGIQLARAGEPEAGEHVLLDAITLARGRGPAETVAALHAWLSTVLRQRGNLGRAREVLVEAEEAMVDVPVWAPHWWVAHLVARAQIAIDTGDTDSAFADLREGFEAIQTLPDLPVTAAVAEATARALLCAGDAVAAARLLGISIAIRGTPDLGNPDLSVLESGIDARIGVEARTAAVGDGRGLDRVAAVGELCSVLGAGQPTRLR
ncbi:Predicted ATPase [Actinokineospora alba]|uniref:Predicted ATPase n=1 Tax=Actinokineospora alba TaxID=504798 RepID=A0A1H0SUF1_9PSEU|nr:BTAD domain-containing putative transcriptional regulator [Actinokineospora alba]TDP66528.1 putative ATPase [Actinokineospora alba]SDJ37045.1 Predicted ATPase [Actinokineospora alba]SDP45422.1 Predicted ATPase [Actinokineospora alba]